MKATTARPCLGASLRLAAGVTAAAALLAGCGTTTLSKRSADPDAPTTLPFGRDGPPANPPPNLELVPDAEPRVEPIRLGGANRPYEMFGAVYVPITDDRGYDERGLASWYGRRFHGRRTSSGETYNMYAMTAAHRTLPIPSYARVRNPANGRAVVVRINDRGPFHSARLIDLSYTAALKLGVLNGTATVEVRRLTHADILAGDWRREPADDGVAARPAEGAPDASSTAAVAAPATLVVTDLAPVAAVVGGASAPARPRDAAAATTLSGDAPPSAATTPPGRAFTPAQRGFWVQLGAFRDPAGAEELHRRAAADLGWLAPLLAVFHESPLHRLQAGPYASRAEAQGALRRIGHAFGAAALVVERR